MSEEILLPRNFCEGLKQGKLELGNSDDTTITTELSSELYGEFEELVEKIKKEHELIDSMTNMIDWVTIIDELNYFKKNY